MEIWRPIPRWPEYEVSNMGRVRSLPRTILRRDGVEIERKLLILRPSTQHGPTPYQRVSLRRPGMRSVVAVHRLVLDAFVGPCPPGMEACHGPTGARDNRLSNLRWDSHRENCEDRDRRHSTHYMSARNRCCRGHIYAEGSFRIARGSRSTRICRRCERERVRGRR